MMSGHTVDTTADALVLTSDFFLLVVTWIRTVGIRKNSIQLGFHTPLMTLLLRDGTFSPLMVEDLVSYAISGTLYFG